MRLSQGASVAEAVRALASSEVAYYRWRNPYGGMRVEQAKRLKQVERENARLRKAVADLTPANSSRVGGQGKLLSPERRRRCVRAVGERLGVPERRACKTLGQHRSVQRRVPKVGCDEAALTAAVTELAIKYGRYGYRRVTALLKRSVWRVNSKRVQREWRQEGHKVPARQPKGGRLWLGNGLRLRLRPEHQDHVRAYDFVADRTATGKAFRLLTMVDEYTRECLAITVDRKLGSTQVLETPGELFVSRGPPEHLRSDNGPEFCAQAVKRWLRRLQVKTLFTEPGNRKRVCRVV